MDFRAFSLIGFLTTTSSFSLHPFRHYGGTASRPARSHKHSSRSDQGWNNDSFLDALSGGQNSLNSANAQYQQESASRAALRERRLQSSLGDNFEVDSGTHPAPQHDEENPTGGQKFREMMKKAEQKSKQDAWTQPDRGQLRDDTEKTEQETISSLNSIPATDMDMHSSDLQAHQMTIYQQQLEVWQQQMTAIAQFSASNPQAAAQMKIPPPPTPPSFLASSSEHMNVQPQQPMVEQMINPAVIKSEASEMKNDNPRKYLPKGSGNKDAYEISNPSDVYLAQLKRDSSVRNEARKRGDLATANSPFEDVGVKALKKFLSEELISSRREQLARNGGEFETSRDEMLIPFSEEEDTSESSYTGVSYRQKLMEVKKIRSNNASSSNSIIPDKSSVQAIMAPDIQQNLDEKSLVAHSSSTLPPVEVRDTTNALPDDVNNISPTQAPSSAYSQTTRSSLRTLQGLILKHRGGTGFGSGRLKEPEATRLENGVRDVMSLLKDEAVIQNEERLAEDVVSMSSVKQTDFMKNRIEDKEGDPSALKGAIACVEAAVAMYLKADPVSQKNLLMPVRNALSSALETMDTTMSGGVAVPEADYATSFGFPDTYKMSKPIVVKDLGTTGSDANAQSIEEDHNTAALKQVYDALLSVTGDKKYGLRDVGSNEISHIKEVLMDMRSVLMDELENGIPEK